MLCTDQYFQRFQGDLEMPSIERFFASSRFFAILLLIGAAAAAAQGPPSSGPDLVAAWSGPTLTVAGVTAGGEAALLLLETHYAAYHGTYSERRLVVTDEDGDGVVSFTIDGDEPSQSLAVIFDLESGSYGLASRGWGHPPEEVPFDSRGRFAHVLGATDLEYDVQRANVFVGRPREGAWAVFVGDSGPLDEDRNVNGKIRIPPQALERIETAGPGPEVFLPHDLLVVVEPRRMEYSVSRLVDPRDR